MVLGAVSCPLSKTKFIADQIRNLKTRHRLPKHFEIKWTKISPSKLDFYQSLLHYYFENNDLAFRAVVIDKTRLNHSAFNQTHDDWYYKMYFNLLKVMLDPKSKYRIYLDIKDTLGGEKIRNLHKILSYNLYDFTPSIIENIQLVHSHEIEQIQLADFLIGIISYINRNLNSSPAKTALVQQTKELSGYSLKQTTLFKEQKCNILIWQPGKSEDEESA